MERRTFLTGALGVVASAGSGQVFSQTPCPPELGINGSTPPQSSCGNVSINNSLAETAQNLSPGQSAPFTPNTIQRENDIQWQTQTIWYDQSRAELQYMGKPASSQSENFSHYVYSESSESWQTTGQNLFPGPGHVWTATFDVQNGDYWIHRYNDNILRWFDRSDGANGRWKQTTAPSGPALNSGNPTIGAIGWHPNLFGTGNPGIFVWGVYRFFAFDLQTQSFSVLNPSDFPNSSVFFNRQIGQSLYLPDSDQLICFARDTGNGHPAVLVEAGAGNSSNVLSDNLVTTSGTPPIQVYGGGGFDNHGHAVNHPGDQDRILLLDEHGSSRVWQSVDRGNSWQIQSDTHPFEGMKNWSVGEYTVGTIPRYGVVIGMTSDTGGGETVIWKPR